MLVEPDTLARRATTVAAVGALMLVLHAISRSGRPLLANWILVIGLSVIVTQRAWITGGIHALVAVFYAIFIVMGGVLIGTRGGVVTAAVCFIGAIVLTMGTANQRLAPRPGAGPVPGAFVFVILAIGLALVLQSLANFRPPKERPAADAVQMLVHDVRSPMQVLLAHLEMLRDDIRGESARDVEAAIGGAVTIRRMAGSLLDISRIEAGRMPVRKTVTDLSVLANSVVVMVRVLQPTRQITVETRGDPSCNCDPELNWRILEYLLSNAMKHTRLDARVRVVVARSAHMATIEVHDSGPGVPRAKQSGIFERFSAEGLRSVTGSESGLGLAFCRLAAEAQGGRIRVEDNPSGGSIFITELPLTA